MLRKIVDRIGWGWIFFLGVVAMYGVAGIFSLPLLERSLMAFVRIFLNVVPVLAVVFLLLFLSGLFLTRERIIRFLGEGSGFRGWLVAIVGGIISAGPIYMWYPLLSDLREKGMKDSLVATFLYNRAIKIPLMPVMIFYFGWAFTIILAFYMIVFSVVDGVIVGRFSGAVSGDEERRGD